MKKMDEIAFAFFVLLVVLVAIVGFYAVFVA